jgi:hypothetical protein
LTGGTSDATAHISVEEKQKVRSIAEDMEQWFYDQLEKQGDLMPYNDPILTVDLLVAKRKELHNATKDIINKPKPLPKKEKEEEKKEDSKEGDAKSEDKGESDAKGDEPKDS